MEYFKHLKEKFPFYLSSGIICAILVFLLVVLNSYTGHLDIKLAGLRKISANKAKIKRQVEEIDAVTAYIKNEFDLDAAAIKPDSLIFGTLDGIKKTLPDATIRVSSSKGPDNRNIHNAEIELPVKDYSMFISSFRYLESFRIPNESLEKC